MEKNCVPHSWFQTFALFWMSYAFFCVISPPPPSVHPIHAISKPYSLTHTWPLCGSLPPHPVPAPTLTTSFWWAQLRLFFESNLFTCHTPQSKPLSDFILTHLWRWNTQCSEKLAFILQMPGNNPEESIWHVYTTCHACLTFCKFSLYVLRSRCPILFLLLH
jgi:hypothetical protein